uniref:HD-GYP domain-containing protein n=1 Tax=Lachnospira sp. TaxID=2049031 RepID=UPI004028911C
MTVVMESGIVMKEVFVDDLKGTEILAVPVITESNVVLIQSDTILKQEYIDKLKEHNQLLVYVKDDIANTTADGTRHIFNIDETINRTQEIVGKVLDRHIYKRNSDLSIIGEAAEEIIDSVISDPDVINSMTEIRNISTDLYTHCINVCSLSTVMALKLKMTKKQVKNIAMGAILHDIGLKYIQAPYIDVGEDELSPKDELEYKKHTIYGYSSIQDENWISDISKEIILLHHENIDGTGFPFQHNGSKIKMEIRIVSVCDEFDSLISGIGNKQLKMYQAIEYMKVHAEREYDGAIVKKLLESVAVYPVGMQVLTNENEVGEVIRQNKDVADRPVMKMVRHSDGSPYTEYVEKDLLKYLTVFIIDIL